MNKIKITCSQPVKWGSTQKPRKTLTYTHKEGGHNSMEGTAVLFCSNLINNMKYRGLKKFTIEVIDE